VEEEQQGEVEKQEEKEKGGSTVSYSDQRQTFSHLVLEKEQFDMLQGVWQGYF
jgi:hypothetical protein